MADVALSALKGAGPARLKALHEAGIDTVRDLLAWLPREYRDLSAIKPLREVCAGDECAVKARVAGGSAIRRAGKLVIVTTRVSDGTDELKCVWYNQPWLMQQLTPGRELLLYGKVEARYGELQMLSPAFESGEGLKSVYKPIKGIPQKTLEALIGAALNAQDGQWAETLPQAFRQEHGLCERNYAILNAHRPIDRDALTAARRRLAFEELLLFQVGLWLLRGSRAGGAVVDAGEDAAGTFWRSLPFAPTNAQRRVLDEVLADMRADYPMARLVQGDVGCGKTAIAFAAMYACVRAGWQCALMAPTEILAAQHYESAKAMLEPLGVTCGLLTGSLTAKTKREARAAIASGAWQAVIGTHALITEDVAYHRLGLVVTDEQHRFGVRQRTILSEKGASPNVLVMSATPIPRTLSLILYGDLDISVVDELPPGRTPVRTRLVPQEKRHGLYGFVREEIAKGRQAYVVCPLVEDSEEMDSVRSARATWEDLCGHDLQGLRVGLTWGAQKAEEKNQTLAAFTAGEMDVLVSTTVIEVGVNVPNATVMVVENAECFGLSQLHQLRGRVGRGQYESWCFLLAEGGEKLRILTKTNDGFLVAQKDLELRGPGDLMGTRQSGEAIQGFLLDGDVQLLEEASKCMKELRRDPELAEELHQVEQEALASYGERLKAVALN